MDALNVAVIGCGVIGRVHAWSLAALAGASPALLVDIRRERAERLAADLVAAFPGLAKPDVAVSADAVWGRADIDAVTIALPHYEHREPFENAVEARKAVICEKPYATSMEDLVRMRAAADAASVPTMGVFQHRYSPLARYIHRSIRSGSLGHVQRVEIDFACRRDESYYSSEQWRGVWKTEGGSLLINQAIHTIDLAVFFLGDPAWVSGRVERRWVPNIETEDWADGSFGYDPGCPWLGPEAVVSLHAENRLDAGWYPRMVITTDAGSIELNGSDTVTSCTVGDADWMKALDESCREDLRLPALPGKSDYSDLHTAQFRDFIAWIHATRNGAGPESADPYEPWVGFSDGSITNELVLAFYTSAAKATRVVLPLEREQYPIEATARLENVVSE